MRVVGIRRPGAGVEVAALADDGATVRVIAGLDEFWADPFARLQAARLQAARREGDDPGTAGTTGTAWAASAVEYVPPVLPGARVICIGLNYLRHVAEGSFAEEGVPPYPTLFGRWTASLTVDGAQVPVPSTEDGLDWEGEVVAWVGAPLVDATPEQALDAVLGYSTFNDLTCRRAQKLTSQWTLGKNGDRSGPLGPMVPAGEVGDLREGLRLVTRVNGRVVQDASTAELVYPVGETLSLISHTLTLHPGDLLATGTPSGVGYARTPPWLLHPGDVVEVEVERIGLLRNEIVANAARSTRPGTA